MLAHMFKMLSEGMTESEAIAKLGTNGRIISPSPYLIYTVTLETLEIYFERLEFEKRRMKLLGMRQDFTGRNFVNFKRPI